MFILYTLARLCLIKCEINTLLMTMTYWTLLSMQWNRFIYLAQNKNLMNQMNEIKKFTLLVDLDHICMCHLCKYLYRVVNLIIGNNMFSTVFISRRKQVLNVIMKIFHCLTQLFHYIIYLFVFFLLFYHRKWKFFFNIIACFFVI